MNSKRRVVVTGVGLVCAVGIGTEQTWRNILAGERGIGAITRFDTSEFSTKIAGEIKDFDVLQYVDKKEARKMDFFIQYAIAASEFAVQDAGLKVIPDIAERVGVDIGSGIGGFSIIEREHITFLEKGPKRISPFFIPASIVNLASGQISMRFKAKGPNLAPCTACTTSTHAIGDATRLIAYGDADAMISGGSEAAITPMGVGGFASMRALSTRNDEPERASRPFDRDRDGFVLGEGAGILVLEELEFARRRGARILAEIVGYGMSADAYHMTTPSEDGDGATRVMENTLKDAGIRPEQVQYINAHGTSTPINDTVESIAIKRVFGNHAKKLAVSSTKSMTGHLLGAAGGLEAGFTVLALRDQILPPTMNYENPDPDCDLDYVPNRARKAPITFAMSNSFGFGGTNGCIIFKKFDE
ncbi:MAG TPA: beta-ketoacyl-ACP synthase II [Acidobacteriota bacterium]|nr:beta-ketoacyl-ACP synthase II [Acidobacteriota bacterium]